MHIVVQTLSKQTIDLLSSNSLKEIHKQIIELHMSRKMQVAVRMGERAFVSGE